MRSEGILVDGIVPLRSERRPEARPWCGRQMMGGRFCNMEAGHKGRCCSVAWSCDGCGKMQRGAVTYYHEEAGAFCFMCAAPEMWPGTWDLSANMRGRRGSYA